MRSRAPSIGRRPRALLLVLPLVVAVAAWPAPVRGAPHASLFKDCKSCHSAAGWKTLRVSAGAIDHARTGFRLVGRHAQLECTACHRPGREPRAPWFGACVGCHDDTLHKGALGGDCGSCHSDRAWRVPNGREVHARTRFPLTGAHLAADCTSCHLRADHALYQDAPTDCYACHAAVYARAGNSPDHVAGMFSQDCSTCHRTTGWIPSRFRHELFFALRGAHASLGCASCHGNGVYGGTPRACDGCHLKDYQAVKAPDHVAAMFPRTCDTCHSVNAWHPARTDWHDQVFLVSRGKHSGIPCAHCHPVATDTSIFRCVSCHTLDQTMPQHAKVTGFVQEDHACLQCHKGGVHL